MYFISNIVKVTIPNYMANLPIPDSIGGWFRLGGLAWIHLVVPILVFIEENLCPRTGEWGLMMMNAVNDNLTLIILRKIVRDWLTLLPPTIVIGGISYYSYQTIKKAKEANQANPCIRKDIDKVVDFIDIEDITEKASLCRCWRSKNWPYCDGSHGAHNKATGDNVGPVVVRHKPAQ